MEEQRQLPTNEGGCWAELSALLTGEESNPWVAFLRRFLSVVGSRGNLDYALNVAHDLTMSLVQSDCFEEAKMMTGVELVLRQATVAEKKERESKPSGMQQSFNVSVNDGGMSVGNLQTDQVVDIHHNNGLKLDGNGSKGQFH